MATEHRDSELRTSREGVSSVHLLPEDNPDVFSDDFAVENLNVSGRSSPASQLSDDDLRPVDPFDSTTTPRRSLSQNVSQEEPRLNVRRSMNKPLHLRHHPQLSYPNRNQSTTSRVSYAQSSTHRTSSTSSRFSVPRSQSPYVGPTGPTQPYGLYPQITRESSVRSGSTVRPAERPFVRAGGPEHPYAMYSQNVAPEDEVPGLPTVGFDRSGQQFQMQRGPEGADFEDIIGPDGHAEQLPPYSRYADNVAPKEAAEYADTPPSGNPSIRESTPRVISMQRSFSHRSNFEISDTIALRTSPRTNVSSSSDESSGTFKEKVKATGRKRVCFGLQIWVIATILAVLLLGALLGGIIGAVLGNHHAQQEAAEASATAEPIETITSTSWIDASPLPTSTNLPLIPLGQFNVPTDDIKLASNSCIADLNLARAWDCMPPGGIGITLKTQASHKRAKYPKTSVIVDPYPLSANFSYGPQLPDLMGKEFPLMPSVDKEAMGLGPALFFFALYDKLTILPEDKITPPPSSKRSVPNRRLTEEKITKRDSGSSGGWNRRKQQIPQPGDRPWFCFFNETALEFFVYVTQNTTESSTTGGFSMSSDPKASPSTSTASPSTSPTDPSASPGTPSTTPLTTSTPSASDSTSPTLAISSVLTSSVANQNKPTYIPSPNSPPGMPGPQSPAPASGPPQRRDDHHGPQDNNNYQDYPLFVKIQEKRKPASQRNVPPYCQQMQILYNYEVAPIEGNTVQIQEHEPPKNQEKRNQKLSFEGRRWILGEETGLERRDNGMVDMGTNCCCEWLSS